MIANTNFTAEAQRSQRQRREESYFSLRALCAFVSPELRREVVREVLKRAGLTGPDQDLPAEVTVRHGVNAQGRTLHYYLNFGCLPVRNGTDLLSRRAGARGAALPLESWDLAIVAETRP